MTMVLRACSLSVFCGLNCARAQPSRKIENRRRGCSARSETRGRTSPTIKRRAGQSRREVPGSLLAAAVHSIRDLPDKVLEALFMDLSMRAQKLSVPNSVLKRIWDMCASSDCSSVTLPATVSPLTRKQVHVLAEDMGLVHKSQGNRRKRQMTVSMLRTKQSNGADVYVADGRGGRLEQVSSYSESDDEVEARTSADDDSALMETSSEMLGDEIGSSRSSVGAQEDGDGDGYGDNSGDVEASEYDVCRGRRRGATASARGRDSTSDEQVSTQMSSADINAARHRPGSITQRGLRGSSDAVDRSIFRVSERGQSAGERAGWKCSDYPAGHDNGDPDSSYLDDIAPAKDGGAVDDNHGQGGGGKDRSLKPRHKGARIRRKAARAHLKDAWLARHGEGGEQCLEEDTEKEENVGCVSFPGARETEEDKVVSHEMDRDGEECVEIGAISLGKVAQGSHERLPVALNRHAPPGRGCESGWDLLPAADVDGGGDGRKLTCGASDGGVSLEDGGALGDLGGRDVGESVSAAKEEENLRHADVARVADAQALVPSVNVPQDWQGSARIFASGAGGVDVEGGDGCDEQVQLCGGEARAAGWRELCLADLECKMEAGADRPALHAQEGSEVDAPTDAAKGCLAGGDALVLDSLDRGCSPHTLLNEGLPKAREGDAAMASLVNDAGAENTVAGQDGDPPHEPRNEDADADGAMKLLDVGFKAAGLRQGEWPLLEAGGEERGLHRVSQPESAQAFGTDSWVVLSRGLEVITWHVVWRTRVQKFLQRLEVSAAVVSCVHFWVSVMLVSRAEGLARGRRRHLHAMKMRAGTCQLRAPGT